MAKNNQQQNNKNRDAFREEKRSNFNLVFTGSFEIPFN